MNIRSLDFLKWYFNKEEYFYITLIDHNNKRNINNYLHNTESFEKYFDNLKYQNTKRSIYFTFNSFNKNSTQKIKNNVSKIKSFVFDFDEGETLENLKSLVKHFKSFNYILQTSKNKYQILFKLKPHGIEFEEFELINKTLSVFFKSDTNVNSIEKLFRLPFSVNKKNEFQTKFLISSQNQEMFFKDKETDIQIFIDFINQNEEVKKIYENLKDLKDKKTSTKKIDMIDTTHTTIFKEDIFNIDDSLIKKYRSIYNRNRNDSSVSDIHYIKDRMKKINDYNIIFNEIIKIRRVLNLPMKRDIDMYYKERYESIYLKNIK